MGFMSRHNISPQLMALLRDMQQCQKRDDAANLDFLELSVTFNAINHSILLDQLKETVVGRNKCRETQA